MTNKKKLSQEEIERRKADWERMNPEKAAERKAKKENKVVNTTEQDRKEENTVFVESKTKLRARSRYMRNFRSMLEERCEAYVEDRDLVKVALSKAEKKFAKMVVTKYYYDPEQEYQPIACAILRELLRWPDSEINEWAYNFLEQEHAKGHIVISLWFIIWSCKFIPADVVRLLLDEGTDGIYYPKPDFKQIVDWQSGLVFKALDYEFERLEKAKAIQDVELREKEVARKTKRIAYFEALISAYELSRKG